VDRILRHFHSLPVLADSEHHALVARQNTPPDQRCAPRTRHLSPFVPLLSASRRAAETRSYSKTELY
jgi:hypothetical protein